MPFTTEQFLNVFRNYNLAVFPMQIIFVILACIIVLFVFNDMKIKHKAISTGLSLLWLWTGVVYHIIFFSRINRAAYGFGALFIIQSIMFFYQGVYNSRLRFERGNRWNTYLGVLMIIYSLIIYPVLGYILGHGYPYQPTFGLPCPTTIFTFGIILLAADRISLSIIIIPFFWSILGFSAAVNLGIYEDIGLMMSGLLTLTIILIQKKRLSTRPLRS